MTDGKHPYETDAYREVDEDDMTSEAGFVPVEVERSDQLVQCAGCGAVKHCSDMSHTMDNEYTSGEDDPGQPVATIAVQRVYLCGSRECMTQLAGDGESNE